jgi:hypothetical protein
MEATFSTFVILALLLIATVLVAVIIAYCSSLAANAKLLILYIFTSSFYLSCSLLGFQEGS